VANVSAATENNIGQATTISAWTVLLPVGTTVTSQSTVEHPATGRKWQIEGNPTGRPDHDPVFIAAAMRLISDMQ